MQFRQKLRWIVSYNFVSTLILASLTVPPTFADTRPLLVGERHHEEEQAK